MKLLNKNYINQLDIWHVSCISTFYGFEISSEEFMFFKLVAMLPFSEDLCYIIISVSYLAGLYRVTQGRNGAIKVLN
jgi:hypothetical protein